MYILGMESSCDETSAAVVEMSENTRIIRSNIIASQIETHRLYGGVGLKGKVTEELRPQLHEGIAYIGGETHLTDHLFNNILGRAKAAVGEDAQHVGRQVLV